MTIHLRFVNLCATVAYDHDITNNMSEQKVTV